MQKAFQDAHSTQHPWPFLWVWMAVLELFSPMETAISSSLPVLQWVTCFSVL